MVGDRDDDALVEDHSPRSRPARPPASSGTRCRAAHARPRRSSRRRRRPAGCRGPGRRSDCAGYCRDTSSTPWRTSGARSVGASSNENVPSLELRHGDDLVDDRHQLVERSLELFEELGPLHLGNRRVPKDVGDPLGDGDRRPQLVGDVRQEVGLGGRARRDSWSLSSAARSRARGSARHRGQLVAEDHRRHGGQDDGAAAHRADRRHDGLVGAPPSSGRPTRRRRAPPPPGRLGERARATSFVVGDGARRRRINSPRARPSRRLAHDHVRARPHDGVHRADGSVVTSTTGRAPRAAGGTGGARPRRACHTAGGSWPSTDIGCQWRIHRATEPWTSRGSRARGSGRRAPSARCRWRMAIATACARSFAPSFSKMRSRWVLTVWGEMPSSVAT